MRIQSWVALLVFAGTLTTRVWGVASDFPLQRDQVRDWGIALGAFASLPLVGPATHVGGYTIGPAFYWILWFVRVTVGPWADNLPHAGGIGQAILGTAADTLLLVAIWRRFRSPWTALATIVLIVTSPFDLSFAAVIWNPVIGATLAKVAMALVLLDVPRRSPVAAGLTAAVAWSAIHAYTGAVFVTAGVFAAILFDARARGDRRAVGRNALAIVAAVALLQLPYVIHQASRGFRDSAMGAVSGSVGQILSGREGPRVMASVDGYLAAVQYLQASPWSPSLEAVGWTLLACGIGVAIRYRRDWTVLAITLVPQLAAIAGYAFFLAELDAYYYLSLMPAAGLTAVLGVTTPARSRRGAALLGAAALAAALWATPARVAARSSRMPEYEVIVGASRRIAASRQPLRQIRTAFALPPTGDAEFVFKILGGRIERTSSWYAIITADGGVVYRRVADR